MLHLGRLRPYSQTLDLDGETCQGQTLLHIRNKHKFRLYEVFITFRTVDSAIKFLQSSLPLQQNKLECFYLARYFFKLLAGKAAAKSTLVVSTHFKALLKNTRLIKKTC